MTLHIDDKSYTSPSLSRLIDHVHGAFEAIERPHIVSTLSADSRLLSKLLVHEWVANLVQHADFGGREPVINIQFEEAGKAVRHVIEDNSHGFDLDTYLTANATVNEPLPERGMGLMILSKCSREIIYRRLSDRCNRLEFVLRPMPMSVDVGADRLAA